MTEPRRTKIGVRMGLPLVREMITDSAIRTELGEKCQWLGVKERREKMKQHHVEKLNRAAWAIADRLARVHIIYSTDRKAVIDQIKEHLRPVKLKYIYSKHLGKNTAWWTYRTRAPHGNGYCYTFTEEEIFQINIIVGEIAARLQRIELVADSDPEEES